MIRMSMEDAKGFYIVHKERPFYGSLTAFMSEGPVVVMVIEGENAISKVRDTMGATNPKDAAPGTIRADFASDIEHNIVHGSDSKESASYEIPYFFSSLEVH
jgi:nucleoside-diphosphate kinase